jgi:hypothetical protein
MEAVHILRTLLERMTENATFQRFALLNLFWRHFSPSEERSMPSLELKPGCTSY